MRVALLIDGVPSSIIKLVGSIHERVNVGNVTRDMDIIFCLILISKKAKQFCNFKNDRIFVQDKSISPIRDLPQENGLDAHRGGEEALSASYRFRELT